MIGIQERRTLFRLVEVANKGGVAVEAAVGKPLRLGGDREQEAERGEE